jgi:hypothetical protein
LKSYKKQCLKHPESDVDTKEQEAILKIKDSGPVVSLQ